MATVKVRFLAVATEPSMYL